MVNLKLLSYNNIFYTTNNTNIMNNYLFIFLISFSLINFYIMLYKIMFLNKTLNKSPIQVTIWNWKW
uniref:ATP synthase F0 subunit 8 n=1 Tax=Linepithema humile TaxID=83485 RepID=A0A0S2A3B5_LINHU|nr:ATP synthase F0 subunit 8 [Linepithema humile]